jgi:hypothetical protein
VCFGGFLFFSFKVETCPVNHTVMKTTLDLPDDLLVEAKTVAPRRVGACQAQSCDDCVSWRYCRKPGMAEV